MRTLNAVIGTHSLSAWQPVPGVVWIQTREPKFGRKLGRRRDSRLVVRGMSGGYLKTFEFRGKRMAWAARLIRRYTVPEMATNARMDGPIWPQAALEFAGSMASSVPTPGSRTPTNARSGEEAGV